jgi:hypothetical protein
MSAIGKERGKDGLRIFLSYATADRTDARKVRSLLSKRPDLRIFTTETLSAGEDWESKLKGEISQCEIFIVLVSPTSVDSKWVLHELGAAWALDKPILAVVTDPEVVSKIPLNLRGVEIVEIKDLEKPEEVVLWKVPRGDASVF